MLLPFLITHEWIHVLESLWSCDYLGRGNFPEGTCRYFPMTTRGVWCTRALWRSVFFSNVFLFFFFFFFFSFRVLGNIATQRLCILKVFSFSPCKQFVNVLRMHSLSEYAGYHTQCKRMLEAGNMHDWDTVLATGCVYASLGMLWYAEGDIHSCASSTP